METNSLILNIQIQGKLESKTEMNDLPDHILGHIISFLPTKFAVQTCVLSKRWKSLWKHLTTVELEEKVYDDMEKSAPEREQFFSFVEKVRKLCNPSCLRKFSLSCFVLDDDAYINDMMKHFINDKVIEELNLELRRLLHAIYFPDSLFQTCESLKKLEISLCHFLPITSHVYFQSLKILVLKDVAFPKDKAQELFSGCPCLEELSIIDCSWNDVREVCISSPMLRKLFIRDSNWGYEIGELIPEEEYSDKGDPIPRCRVMIFATRNFKSFSYQGHLLNDFFLNGCTSVTEASIEIQCRKWDQDWEGMAGCYVFNLLKELSNVKKLSLSSTAILVLGGTMNLYQHLPYFYKLAELRVVSPLPQELSSPALLTMFLNSFCLESIHFDRGVTLSPNDADEEFYCLSNILITCFLTHLKAIHVCSFKGDEGELNAIRVLLEAASVLGTFHIEFDKTTKDCMRPKELMNLKSEILDLPVRSRRCTIEFG